MIDYSEALELIRGKARECRAARSARPESVPLLRAVGRISAVDVASSEVVPPLANSAMDGFAFRSRSTEGASAEHPLVFPVAGLVAAGDVPVTGELRIARVESWEIMTGAPFPEGYDCSIRIEDVKVTRDSNGGAVEVEIRAPAPARQNLRDAGEDFQVGTPVLAAGQRISPEHVLALSSLGIGELQVLPRLRVSLISTGKELAPLGVRLEPGQIRNSTAQFLQAALPALGVEVDYRGIVGDDPSGFTRVMEDILKDSPDLVITTGAVSMGRHDFIEPTLRDLGARRIFHKVAIRPGKPLLFAAFDAAGPVVFGLPGNPVSTVVGLRFFVEPFLRALQGRPAETPLRARLKAPVRKPEGLRCFFKARLEMSEAEPRIRVLEGQLSFLVRPLLESTAWAVLPEEGREAASGAWVDVYPPHSQNHDWAATQVHHPKDSDNDEGECCR